MRFLLVACLTAVAFAAPPAENTFSSKVSIELKAAFQEKPTANIFVIMKDDTSGVLRNLKALRFANRQDRITALRSTLLAHAEVSQRNVSNYLQALKDVHFESLWINNQIYVRNATPEIVRRLESFAEIKSIDEEFFANLIEPVASSNATVLADEHQWGVMKIQAPEAWKVIGSNNLRNIRVATIDTGVRGTHEALRDNFLGEHGWFDPSTKEEFPSDRNGHGTHTTGTIAGGKGVGVAPGATWMACRGCATSACSQFDLNRCGQFFACPTLSDGKSSPDCSLAPHLVSNSWGGGRGSTWFQPVLDAWAVVGIIPVFSIGNSGPNCDTANSPGDNVAVVGVGSTRETDELSGYSSRGPTYDGRMKPDIAAPGESVISAYFLADDAYRSLSGTSMAAPHVAGTVALLLARNEDLTVDDIRKLLFQNTDKDLSFAQKSCENIPDDQFPNHMFGSGRLNALKSVVAQTKILER